MNVAKELVKIYGDLSTTHHADTTDLEELQKLIDKITAWEKGSNTDKNSTGGGQPIIAVSAPGGMAMSSGEEMALTSGTNLDIVTQQSMQIISGKNLVTRVKDRISLFAYKLGIKIIAASGKVEIQAHSNNIEMTAAKNIFGTALEEVTLKCKKFTIIADGASYEIGGGNGIVSKTSGTHVRHAGKHTLIGPAGVSLVLPELPISEPAKHSLRWKVVSAVDGRSAKGMDTISMLPSSEVIQSALTGGDGRSDREFAPTGPENRVALLGSGDWVVDVDSDLDPVPMDRDDDDEEDIA